MVIAISLLHTAHTQTHTLTLTPSTSRVRFVSEEPRKTLFKYHPTPRTFYDAAYGEHWWEHSVEQWAKIYDQHHTKIQSLKKYCKKENLLEIDLTIMGKQGLHDSMWGELTSFLKLNAKRPPKGTAFPHRFVFRYSAVDQPKRQLGYAKARFLTWKHFWQPCQDRSETETHPRSIRH